MLDTKPQTAEAASAPLSSYKVGDYAVYPRLGLSVISARKEMDIAGLKLYALEVRPLHDLKTSVSIPEPKVRGSGLRRPASAADFKDVLTHLAGKAKGDNQRWHVRAQKYEERMKSSELRDVASVVRDILGKFRNKTFANLHADDVPPEVVISYSERVLVKDALDILSREMAFATGVSVSEATRLFISAALDPQTKAAEKQFADAGEISMVPKKFEALFGRNIRAASKAGDNPISLTLPTITEPPARRPSSGVPVDRNSNFSAPAPKATRGRKGSGVASKPALDAVKPELRALYNEYSPLCTPYGYKGSAFKMAAQYSTPEEFELLCQLMFVQNDYRKSPEKIAEKMGISVDEVWKRGEQAFNSLKKYGEKEKPKTFEHIRFPSRDENMTASEATIPETNRKIYDDYKNKAGTGNKTIAFRAAARLLPAEDFKLLTEGYLLGRKYVKGLAELAAARSLPVEEIHARLEKALALLKEKTKAGGPTKTIAGMAIPGLNSGGGGSSAAKVDFAETLKPDTRAVYKAETESVPVAGTGRSLFRKAAQILSGGQYAVLCATALRVPDKRQTIEAYAESEGMKVEDALKLRNEASAALKKATQATYVHPALDDYKKPADLAPQQSFVDTLSAPAAVVYNAETALVPDRGTGRTLFRQAAQVLNVPQFEVLSATALRKGEHRMTIRDYADAKRLQVEGVLALRNAASKLLRVVSQASYNHAALEDYKEPEPANNVPARQSFIDSLPPEARALYQGEDGNVHPAGVARSLLKAAVEKLTPAQFDVLARTALRVKAKQMTIEAYAADKKISVGYALALRNEAAETLARHVAGAGYSHIALSAYVAPAVPLSHFTPRQELREVFAAENKFSPAKGLARSFFIRAAETLNPDEFEILSKTTLRLKENLMALDDVAAEKGLSREEVLAIRNAASKKLRAGFRDASPRILNYSALNDYAEPAQPSRPHEQRTPVDMKVAGEIMDGKFRIVLEMPLEAIKGIDYFRLEGDILGSGDIIDSIAVSGKVGKGRGGHFKAGNRVSAPKLEK